MANLRSTKVVPARPTKNTSTTSKSMKIVKSTSSEKTPAPTHQSRRKSTANTKEKEIARTASEDERSDDPEADELEDEEPMSGPAHTKQPVAPGPTTAATTLTTTATAPTSSTQPGKDVDGGVAHPAKDVREEIDYDILLHDTGNGPVPDPDLILDLNGELPSFPKDADSSAVPSVPLHLDGGGVVPSTPKDLDSGSTTPFPPKDLDGGAAAPSPSKDIDGSGTTPSPPKALDSSGTAPSPLNGGSAAPSPPKALNGGGVAPSPPEGLGGSGAALSPPKGVDGSSVAPSPPKALDGGGAAVSPPKGLDGGGPMLSPPKGVDGGGVAPSPPKALDGGGMAASPPKGLDGGGTAPSPPKALDGGGAAASPPKGLDGGGLTLSPPPPPPPPAGAGLHGNTHRERNPAAPHQPERPLKLGGTSTGNVQANALQNTNTAQNSTKKEAREKLKEAVEEFKVDLAKRIKDLAAELDLEEKAYSLWDAQVWAKGLEVNTGKKAGERLLLGALQALVQADNEKNPPTKDEQAALMKEYGVYREAKDKGTAPTNRSAAVDVTWTMESVYDELLRLEQRTGARSILLVSGSDVSDTIVPTCVGSAASLSFVPAVLKMTTTAFASTFEAYSRLKDEDLINGDFASKRARVVSMLNTGLCTLTNKSKLRMEYKNYEEKMMHNEGVMLVGWPEAYEMKAPSNATNGGAERVDHLLRLLIANELRWEAVPPAKREELRKKYENAPKKPRKPRTKKNDEAGEGGEKTKKKRSAAADKEVEEGKGKGKPKPKPKKRSRANDDEDEAIETENDESDATPPPAKKAKPTPTDDAPKKKRKRSGEADDERPVKRSRKAKEAEALRRSEEETAGALAILNARRKKVALKRAEEEEKRSLQRTLREIDEEEDE
ncbi:hypothetical protein B0H13DRAFT_2364981 [Mycena leptocephala]|nr:hypothetical protein B0H13DRAFT_2364981 [Mycena leptocephala]